MASIKSIKESKELLWFLALFVSTTDTVLEDGKVGRLELLQYYDSILAARPGIEGMKDIPAEFADLDEEEHKELVSVLANGLKLRNEQAEYLVEKGFNLAIGLSGFILEVGRMRRGQDLA
jgi:hypothetical protein